MQKIRIPSLCLLGLLFFGGCAQKEIVFNQKTICQAPIAKIFFQNVIKKEGHGSIAPDELKGILKTVITNTGCFEFTSSAQEDGYVLNAVYEGKMTNQSQKSTFKSQTINTFHAKVTLNLSHSNVIRREFGESIITVEENKVLGMGASENISVEDEQNAIRNSTLVAIKNFIAAIQKEQAQEQSTQEQNTQETSASSQKEEIVENPEMREESIPAN